MPELNNKTKYIIGFLTVVLLLSGVVYISLGDKVRIRIDENKAVFYNKDLNEQGEPVGRWLISGLQEDRLFKGTSIIDRVKSSIQRYNYTEDNLHIEVRDTTYKNGEQVIHTWKFNPNTDDVLNFPLYEEICVSNAKDKFYRYSVKQLTTAGLKRKVTSPVSFGRNMKIDFQDGYNWAWVGYPYGKSSFAVQYKIKSDNECFNVRLFDPPINIIEDMQISNSVGSGRYKVIRKDGNESGYKVNFSEIKIEIDSFYDEELKITIQEFRTDVIIEIIAEEEEINITNESKNESYMYTVPKNMKLKTNKKNSFSLNKTLKKHNLNILETFENGDRLVFTYQANPLIDKHLKFGENSIEIVQISDIVVNSLAEDVVGEGNLTHLNISNNAPWDSLILYLPMDSNISNTTVYDYTENNNDGTIINATFNSNCLYGGCYEFDGVSSNIDTNYGGVLLNHTISVWVKRLSTGSDMRIVQRGTGARPQLYYSDGGNRFSYRVYNGSDFFNVNGPTGISEDIWTHLVGVLIDNVSVSLYVNGIFYSNLSFDGSLDAIAGDWFFGSTSSLTEWFNGSIDEVMVFNTALNSSQILEIYNNQSARFKSQGNLTTRAKPIIDGQNKVSLNVDHESLFGSNISARVCQINDSLDDLTGLVYYAPFEWGKAFDIFGNNDGTITNAAWNKTGGLNDTGAFEFDGINDFIELDGINLTNNNWTISFWGKPTGSGEREVLVDTIGIANQFGIRSAGYWSFYNGSWEVTTATALNGVWQNLIYTYDDSNENMTLYMDNILIKSFVKKPAEDFILNQISVISNTFNGSIDELRIYNRSLSATEIQTLYNNTVNKYNTIYYTPYQNLTDSIEKFTISPEADYLCSDFKFLSGTNNFYSPIIKNNVILSIKNFYFRLKGIVSLILRGNGTFSMRN